MRKSFLLGMLMAVLLPWAAMQAEELTVNDGTSTLSQAPVYGLYADYGTRSQFVVPAESLSEMENGTITAMKFYSSSTSQSLTGTWEVYLAEVTETSASSTFISRAAASLVWTGSVVVDNGEFELEFADTYAYGGGNLMIEFVETAVGNCPSFSWYGVSGTAVYKNGTTSDHTTFQTATSGSTISYVPKVTFTYAVGSGPTCEKPSAILLSDTTDHSMTLTWGDGSGVYNVEYKKASAENWISVLENTTQLTTTLTDLDANTAYQARVQSICADTVSSWRNVSFKTACGYITSFPWTEDFESYAGSTTPECWDISASTSSSASGSSFYYIWGVYSGTNNKMMRLYNSMAQRGTAIIVTPNIVLPESGLYELSFDYVHAASCGEFSVLASLDGLAWDTLQSFAMTTASASTTTPTSFPNEAVISLGNYAGQTFMLQFFANADYGSGAIFVDNISIYDASCVKPTELAASEITTTSADLAWEAADDQTVWQLEYKKSASSEWIPVEVTENPYTLENLDVYTAYDVRVAAKCDENISKYSNVVNFKTAATAPFAEAFTSLPSDWKRYSALLETIWAGEDTLTNHPVTSGWVVASGNSVFGTTSHLKLRVYGENVKNWIVSPFIQMDETVDMQLTFDLALTKYSGTLTPAEAGQQDDDKFYVLVTTDGGESWEELYVRDNTSSADSYDNINCSADGQTVKIDLSAFTGSTIALAFYGESTVTGGDNYLHIRNLNIDTIPNCEKPMGLVTMDITASTATFAWDEAEGATWQYGVALDTVANFVPTDEMFTGSTTDYMATVDELTDNTKYIFFMRRDCDGAYSEFIVRRFSTIQIPAAVPFEDDFEGANNWLLINGTCTNQWVLGEAVNNGGTHALYISNDNGVSNDYTHSASMVYATKTFEFEEDGTYTFKYDWKANGESTWDYIRMALVPAGTELEASTSLLTGLSATALPTGWIALDGGTKLNLVTAWETKSADIELAPGTYKVVIAWRNDGSGGTTPPGAIDNFSVKLMLCARPENVALATGVDSIATTSALIDWEAQGGEANWLVQYKKSAEEEWTAVAEPVTAHPFLLEGLKAATAYDVKVAAWCNPADSTTISEYSEVFSFATECAAITEFPYSENFDGMTGTTSSSTNILPLCWDYINTTTYSTYSGLPQVYKSTASHSGENLLRFYSYNYVGGSTDYDPQDQYAILPEMANISGLRMKLFARKYSSSYDATFYVGVLDGENFDTIASFSPTSATDYVQYTILFNEYAGNGTHIAIMMPASTSSYRSVYIDDVVVDPIPTCLEPQDLTVTLTKGNGSVAELNWAAGAASNYVVEYGLNEDFTEAIAVPVDTNVINLTGLTAEATYYARVKVVCSENDESPWSVISFVPTYTIIVNEGTTTNSYVPVYGTYVDDGTTSQFIIPEEELQVITWDSITKLTFFSSTASVNWGAAQFEVYMAPISATSLSSMEDWTNMTKVMDAKSLSIADKQMEVILDYPFQYQGGNLLVGFKQTVTGSYVSASWYGKSATGASMSAYGTNAAAQRNFLPMMQIDHVAGVAPSCLKVKDIQISDITASSATLAWTNGAEDQEAWQIVLSLDEEIDLAEATPIDVASNPFALADLENDTTYYVYVRANCGEGDFSEWSRMKSFHTAKACQTADDLAVEALTSTTATVSWNTYGQTGFNLRYYAGTDTVLVENVETPYQIQGLEAGTIYYFQVQTACSITEEEPEGEWSAAYGFKTAYGVPFSEPFNSSPTASGGEWIQASGLLADILSGEAQLTSASSGWTFTSSSTGVFGDPHIYCNIWSTSSKKWIISPAIEVNGNVQLSFDMALTKSSTAHTAITPGNQADDKFAVLITTDNGATWSVLRQWDNAGSADVYDNISTEGAEYTINLSAYSGNGIYFAFYGESTVSGGDNYLHIDNVLIDIIPACPKSTGLHIEALGANEVTLAWNAEEDVTWEYGLVPDTVENFVPADADFTGVAMTNEVTIDTLAEQTAYLFFMRKVCGEEKSEILYQAFKTIQTPAALPYDDDFEAGNSWLLINDAAIVNAWAYGTAATESGNALYISNDGGVTNAYTNTVATTVYAAKAFNFDKEGTYTISYDWKANGESSYDLLRVAVVPATVELVAGSAMPSGLTSTSGNALAGALPTGWIAADGGSKLNLSTEWAHKSVVVEVPAGIYNLVLLWRDDTSGGNDTPAAVDNIHIQHLAYPTAIENGNAGVDAEAQKFIRNDQVYILVNGVVYDVTGRKVEMK